MSGRAQWVHLLCLLQLLLVLQPSLLSADENIPPDGATPSAQAQTQTQADVTSLVNSVEAALRAVHTVSSGARGALCVTKAFLALPVRLDATKYATATRQASLAAALMRPLGPAPAQEVLEAVAKALARTAPDARGARALVLSGSEGGIIRAAAAPEPEPSPDPGAPWWQAVRETNGNGSLKWEEEQTGELIPENGVGRWSAPYYSCAAARWLLSYTILIPGLTPESESALVSLDVDVSGLELNQCDGPYSTEAPPTSFFSGPDPLDLFRGTHKCSNLTTECSARAGRGWTRGAYVCRCRDGFYSPTHPQGFNGSLVEEYAVYILTVAERFIRTTFVSASVNFSVAWQERDAGEETSGGGWAALRCLPCAEGCLSCKGPQPCRALYNWPFRSVLLGISAWCAGGTALLAAFLHRHRRARVFRSASPVFLAITLLGCAIMYLEMAAIFPVLDIYSCVATKWCRHLGFCITYTALLMKTWRVSLTYRVKSAHAVKLTERQLLRWLLPVLLVALVYLGTWTLSDPPHAEDITDQEGLKFKQCAYNWWDHSLAFGELAFLLWGIRVCYGVRHAESLYNEARLISYAIYNIAAVNCLMLTFHLLIFPRVGPDMKYFLGFVRTQLSTSVTVALVFGPKVVRVWRGFGDQWDSRAARGVSASFSLNGIGSVHPHPPPTPHDLAQENDELKEEVQKLAAQIEFMKIVQMELHNRHLRPRPGGHFTLPAPPQPQGSDEVEKEKDGNRGG